MQKNNICAIALATLLSLNSLVWAETFEYHVDDSVVGNIAQTHSNYEQTLPDIARLHNLGYHEIKLANPDVDTWLPGEEERIVLPKHFVLPVASHEGIIINIPEMRLYYFPPSSDEKSRQVITHPIGIGREGWSTPYINTKIIQKNRDPHWYPPESVREHYAQDGKILPKVVKPGPENPLGRFAMRLGLPSYLIHGTNRPFGVGMRVSSGCIRLYPEDIESLFNQITLGTRVNIVNQPYKVGVIGNSIYLEANPFLEEDAELFDGNLTSVVKMLVKLSGDDIYNIDWDLAKSVIDEQSGLPVEIGTLNRSRSIVAANNTEDVMDENSAINPESSVLKLKLDTGITSE
ncbi:MAG: L,D-transpeptidase family protein [Gammaproteobacteria bacterium]|nr:L,D-transpeptidase family protein [Gammaproteobacteria bacterium]